MIRPVPSVGAMGAYALADLGGSQTISLAQNESAFPASPAAVAAGQAALVDLTLYPDPEWPDMRTAIAEVHELDPTRILCGAGSMELIGCPDPRFCWARAIRCWHAVWLCFCCFSHGSGASRIPHRARS